MAGQKDTIAGDYTARFKENDIADNNVLYNSKTEVMRTSTADRAK
jgi:hypothetical protein